MHNFSLPKPHFFRYLQIRSFIKSTFKSFPEIPSIIEAVVDLKPEGKGLISHIYSLICAIDPQSLDHVKNSWQSDLGRDFTDIEWAGMLDKVHSSSPCARHALIQFKILHRLHFTNSKLARIYPTISPACIRCKHSPATTAHMFWSCPKLEVFWKDIFKSFSDIYDVSIDPDPLLAVFGTSPESTVLTVGMCNVIAFTTLLARRLILFHWKKTEPPTHNRWVKEVMCYIQLEKI